MTILTNARIHTLDERGTVADTLVVRDGRVAFVGRESDVSAAAGEPTLDLGGRAVLPGLVDAHGHLMYLARGRMTLDVGGVSSEEAIAARVAAAAAVAPQGRVDQRAGLGPEPLARAALSEQGLARSGGAAASRRAGSHRRPRDLGQLGGAPRGRDLARHRRPDGRHRRQGRRRRAHGPADRHGAAAGPARRALAVRGALRRGRARGHRRVPVARAHRPARDGCHPVRAGLVSTPRRARAVSVPELRRRGRPLGGDLGLLSGPRPRGDRRRPGGRARAQAHVGWRARLARGRAALAVLRRSRQPRPPADPRGGARPAHERRDRARLSGLRPRHRGSREHAHARHVRAGPGPPSRRGPRGAPARRARPDPRGDGHPALSRPRRGAEHAGDALHLGHGLGHRAARPRPPQGRLCLALAARHRRRHRRGIRLPRREPQSLSRHLRVGRAAAPDGRGPRVAARAAHDEARGRALLHDVECLCRPPGGRAGRARPRASGPISSSAPATSSPVPRSR